MSNQAVSPADKHPSFIVRQAEPLNGGPPLELLVEEHLTPQELFFVRTHGTVPQIDPNQYRLSLDGLVERPQQFTLADLAHFPQHSVVSTIQCAGNRRSDLLALVPIPGETPWGAEAISTAAWRGVRLRDLLEAAGVQAGVGHVAFLGLDQVEKDGHEVGFGGSVPLEWALRPDVLLATHMNGEPLTPTHGAPLRLVVPGYIGARSVKWLGQITVQLEPSQNYFQAHAYRLFPPQASSAKDEHLSFPLGELSLNSVICSLADGVELPIGPLVVRGYAMAGGNRTLARVDLSLDEGCTWQQAALPAERAIGVWSLWQATVNITPATKSILVRAWDSAANTQPHDPRSVWNCKGYMNNAWHRVGVKVATDFNGYDFNGLSGGRTDKADLVD